MTRDYVQAWRDAKAILIPPQQGGRRFTDDEWRLARAQWFYDYVSKAMGERELKEINMYRATREHDNPGAYPPVDLDRSRRGYS